MELGKQPANINYVHPSQGGEAVLGWWNALFQQRQSCYNLLPCFSFFCLAKTSIQYSLINLPHFGGPNAFSIFLSCILNSIQFAHSFLRDSPSILVSFTLPGKCDHRDQLQRSTNCWPVHNGLPRHSHTAHETQVNNLHLQQPRNTISSPCAQPVESRKPQGCIPKSIQMTQLSFCYINTKDIKFSMVWTNR